MGELYEIIKLTLEVIGDWLKDVIFLLITLFGLLCYILCIMVFASLVLVMLVLMVELIILFVIMLYQHIMAFGGAVYTCV